MGPNKDGFAPDRGLKDVVPAVIDQRPSYEDPACMRAEIADLARGISNIDVDAAIRSLLLAAQGDVESMLL